MTSNIDDAVKAAFDKAVEDFDRSCEEGQSIFWNEDTFRMSFFKHLCEQKLKIKRFFSEFTMNLWGKKHIPDLVVHYETNDELVMVAFEFKFFSGGWKEDWEKIRSYLKAGFKYGNFLAIGTKSLASELPSKHEIIDSGRAEAFIYEKLLKEAFGYAPLFRIAENLLKQTLDMPYTVNIILQLVTTIPEEYAVAYTFQEDKCLLLATFQKEEMWERIKKELVDAGFKKFLSFKVDEWAFEPTTEFEGIVLVEELPLNSYRSTASKAQKTLRRLMPVLAGLKPAFKLK